MIATCAKEKGMLRTKDFDVMARIVHRHIFPSARFVKTTSLELVIRIDARQSVGTYQEARKNIQFLFPNCDFVFGDGSHIKIETGVLIDHSGCLREMKKDD